MGILKPPKKLFFLVKKNKILRFFSENIEKYVLRTSGRKNYFTNFGGLSVRAFYFTELDIVLICLFSDIFLER